MKRVIITGGLALALVGMCIASVNMQAERTAFDNGLHLSLVGTWRLVSMKIRGEESRLPEISVTYKHITPCAFMWVSYEPVTGRIFRAAGGTYTILGNNYTEKIEYGVGGDYEIIKSTQPSFTAKVDGDRWYHDGILANGTTIEEIWERLKPEK